MQIENDKEIRLKELELKNKEADISKPNVNQVKAKVCLPKFIEGQTIEVYLTSFKMLAALHEWDKSQWPIRLIPN